jgi:glycosyltransferase involved in cell wall biosynthesis
VTPPAVSAVICTRNRPDKISYAVASVLDSDYPSFELTVIDQSTSDATEVALTELIERDDRLHYFHVTEAGLSRAYNTAIARTSGDIIVFTDDDCLVPVDWISKIVAAFADDDEGELLYGRVQPASFENDDAGLTPTLEIPQPTRLSRHDGFRVFGMGANFAARRTLFSAIGGFDEVLGGGGPLRSSQDFDLAYRAYRAGSVILLRPEVSIAHDGRRDREDWPTLLRNYGIGDGAFYSKHVRCGDPYAFWLLVRRVGQQSGRTVMKRTLRKGGRGETTYLRGFFRGVRDGFKFTVDRRERLYRFPAVAESGAA